MTAVLLTPLTGQFFDNNGDPLNGGLVYSYVAGTAFGTPLATYTSATGSTPAANPVVLNSAGRADIWGAGTYDFKITDADGNTIDTVMSVTAIFGSGDMTKAVYDPANIAQQLVGTTATQTLTNKSLTDSSTFITDNSDATKKLAFECSGITAATTRTLTAPDASGTILLAYTPLTNSLGADVNLSNTSNYFDGPTVAQGTTGTWFASGTVSIGDTVTGSTFDVKLWDGTTVIASARTSTGSAAFTAISLSGYLAAPAGNIRISVKDVTTTGGTIRFNSTGNSKDSTISAFRIA